MSVLLARKEANQAEQLQHGFRVVYSPEQLNRAYAVCEQKFNGLASNWEWFKGCKHEVSPLQEVEMRIDQN